MYKEEFDFAKSIAKNVGVFLASQNTKQINSLEGRDIKLQLDTTSEEKIISSLQSQFDHPILSEESGMNGQTTLNQPYWIIDPIDGTMNYSRNCPLACVSIALWVNSDPLFGIVYDFNRDELFSGIVGEGAWLNEIPIQPSGVQEKSSAILATGFPTYLELSQENLAEFISKVTEYKKIRMFGTAALSLCYVACGRVDSYMEKNIKLWDVAAGVAINRALNIPTEVISHRDFNTTTIVGI